MKTEEKKMEINLLTATTYPEKGLCSSCKHYKETATYSGKVQCMDKFCIDCYSEKVYILTRFERKETCDEGEE